MSDETQLRERIVVLETAATELLLYTESVLTGPIMVAAGVVWPDGVPQGPVLRRMREALRWNNTPIKIVATRGDLHTLQCLVAEVIAYESPTRAWAAFAIAQSTDYGNRPPYVIIGWARLDIIAAGDGGPEEYITTTSLPETDVPMGCRAKITDRFEEVRLKGWN